MKITYIVDHLFSDLAGTENQVVKLLRGLGTRHQIQLLALRDTPWLRAAAGSLPCEVVVFELNGIATVAFWVSLWRLFMHLRRSAPDLVHTFFPVANIFGVLAARLAGVRQVIGSRRDYGHWMTPAYLRATRFANRAATGIVTNSAQVAELTARVEGFPAGRIEVIHNGLDVAALQARPGAGAALRARLGIPADHRVITLVGNYRPVKRHDTLLEAFAALRRQRQDVSLLLVGAENHAEPAYRRIVERAEALGVTPFVHYSQACGDVADHLDASDVGVNCSESEGLSNAVIEYMCARLPCVISDGGGNKDLVHHGENGLMFPVGDVAALTAALERVLDDPADATRMADAAHDWVCAEMDLSAILERFEAYYQRQLSPGPGGAATPRIHPVR